MKFIDIAKILIKSGDGGAGHVSFRREKYVPKGGPDGGNGGKGGDVIIKTDQHLNTLLDFKYKMQYKAENGKPGEKSRRSGKGGDNVFIRVPCGTLIKSVGSEETIADLIEPGEEFIAAVGGKGGRGNSEFATSTNQTPRFAEEGMPGAEMEIILELKLIADVGLVGLPNAGKSTLISVISASRPKIADYPFTTLVPNLGIVGIADYESFTVADIPGLIEGAHEGKGLGIQFLRHIERTRALVFLIDAGSLNLKEDYMILKNELKKYNPELLKKNMIICITKLDIATDEDRARLAKIKFDKNKIPALLISSVSGENIKKLKFMLWDMLKPPLE